MTARKCSCCGRALVVVLKTPVCPVCDAVPSWPSQRGGTR